MAATSNAPAKKGFSITKPGTREYLIVGGIALAGGLIYFWWKKRQAAAAAAAEPDTTDTGTGTSAPSTPTGLNTADWLAWVQDHSSSSTTATTGGGGGTTSTGTTTTSTSPASTPDYWNTAIDLLKKDGIANPTHAQIEAMYRKITPLAQRKKEEALNKAAGKK
jgi:hypothetical protein